MANIESVFIDAGGEFLIAAEMIGFKLIHVNTFLFDWDGVFHSGAKGTDGQSSFSEIDSMGLNMLRFGYWLKNGKLPVLGIISGQNNKTAIQLAKREHIDLVYLGFNNKLEALGHLKNNYSTEDNQVAFCFDDILDLSIASKCGLRLAVKNNATPLFKYYIEHNNLADYITGNSGSNHAVREICEMLLGVLGNYNETISERVAFSETYTRYLAERNSIHPKYYKAHSGDVVEQEVE